MTLTLALKSKTVEMLEKKRKKCLNLKMKAVIKCEERPFNI